MIFLIPYISFLLLFFGGRFLGKTIGLYAALIYSVATIVCGLVYANEIILQGAVYKWNLGQWFSIGNLEINWQILLDPLSITFVLLISIITFLILVYSMDYMRHDPNQLKFFAYLSFFSGSMLCLVTAGNYMVMFLGWEAVGLSSYLLINFWSSRNQANKSALKAIILNRLGDCFFIAAMGCSYTVFYTLDIELIEVLVPELINKELILFNISLPIIEVLAFFFFIAAAAKSAQLFLHVWLPDAMEGPTPVSALLHSATMVTAGVFLILRSTVIFSNAPIVCTLIALLGFMTAIMASFIGLVQNDIKKIIAYSTCSQLGFMFASVGLQLYTFALFHLINHAFFKALLFLCAGSVIHATNEQDIRKLGQLKKYLPITYYTMLIASLSLIGFPFLSGFYSKDYLLTAIYSSYNNYSFAIFLLLALSCGLSAFYSFRLIILVFHNPLLFMQTKREASVLDKKYFKNLHGNLPKEGSPFMWIPLIILACFSIFSGYLLSGYFFWSSIFNFNTLPIQDNLLDFEWPQYVTISAMSWMDLTYKLLPTICSFIGLYIAFWWYIAILSVCYRILDYFRALLSNITYGNSELIIDYIAKFIQRLMLKNKLEILLKLVIGLTLITIMLYLILGTHGVIMLYLLITIKILMKIIGLTFLFGSDYIRTKLRRPKVHDDIGVYQMYSEGDVCLRTPYSKTIKVAHILKNLFSHKFFFDAIYQHYIVRSFSNFCLNNGFILLEKGIFEQVGPLGISRSLQKTGDNLKKIELVTLIFKSLGLLLLLCIVLCLLTIKGFTTILVIGILLILKDEKKTLK